MKIYDKDAKDMTLGELLRSCRDQRLKEWVRLALLSMALEQMALGLGLDLDV